MLPVYLVAGARTPIGSFGGSLKDFAPSDLGAIVIAEAVRRAALTPADVQHVVMGQGITTGTRDGYAARVAAVKAGVPVEAPALALNRQCGSGLQAIVSAAQMVALGECDVAVGGGAEVMSRAAHVAVAQELGFDPTKTNPNGSGIALGHPVGATGAILTIKTMYELQRTGGSYGLITMCISGGQGIAMVIERTR